MPNCGNFFPSSLRTLSSELRVEIVNQTERITAKECFKIFPLFLTATANVATMQKSPSVLSPVKLKFEMLFSNVFFLSFACSSCTETFQINFPHFSNFGMLSGERKRVIRNWVKEMPTRNCRREHHRWNCCSRLLYYLVTSGEPLYLCAHFLKRNNIASASVKSPLLRPCPLLNLNQANGGFARKE